MSDKDYDAVVSVTRELVKDEHDWEDAGGGGSGLWTCRRCKVSGTGGPYDGGPYFPGRGRGPEFFLCPPGRVDRERRVVVENGAAVAETLVRVLLAGKEPSIGLRLIKFKRWSFGDVWINPADVSTVRVEESRDGSEAVVCVKSILRMSSGEEIELSGDFVAELKGDE